jgi:hypothetical protein
LTAASPAPAPVRTDGEPFGLHLENGGILTFCANRGGRQLDLTTGRETALDQACPSRKEPNTACAHLKLDVAVSSPLSEPNDRLDIEGRFMRLKGRLNDCAADGNVLVVAKDASVVLVDAAQETTKEINRQGGDRVAIGSGWVAWSRLSLTRNKRTTATLSAVPLSH